MSARWISLAELEEVIGKTNAALLCREFGGLSCYLPATPGPDHQFARIIGMPALSALAKYTGGWHLEMPNLRRAEPSVRRIREMLAQGLTHRVIARECRVTERWVREVASQRREVELRLPL